MRDRSASMRISLLVSLTALLVLLSATHAFSVKHAVVPSKSHRVRRNIVRRSADLPLCFLKPIRPSTLLNAAASASGTSADERSNNNDDDDKLPSTVTPILLTVLALIISEGIALSTLPLHLQSLGATPVQVGLSTSAFSVAQMVCCPPIVSLSSRKSFGRRKTLNLCLAGAALSSCMIATATAIPLIIFGRFLAGMFAAAIPVAQAGVTDLVPPTQATLALSRVSAASQTGLVIGPIASAVVQTALRRVGVAPKNLVRGVFAVSAAFALLVLSISGTGSDSAGSVSVINHNGSEGKAKEEQVSQIIKAAEKSTSNLPLASTISKHAEFVQPLLRIIALAAGWALTLSVAIYSLFSSKFLGYQQSQLSSTMSGGAATTILTQIFVVPPLVKKAGEHLSCSLGLWTLAIGLAGMSLIRIQPYHIMLYLLVRVGCGVTDTSTATLVAQNSNGKEEKARNLGMIQSTRAGARIVTPVLSGSLFAKSCQQTFPMAGSLPYLVNAALAFALTPLPLVLKRMEKKNKAKYVTKETGSTNS